MTSDMKGGQTFLKNWVFPHSALTNYPIFCSPRLEDPPALHAPIIVEPQLFACFRQPDEARYSRRCLLLTCLPRDLIRIRPRLGGRVLLLRAAEFDPTRKI